MFYNCKYEEKNQKKNWLTRNKTIRPQNLTFELEMRAECFLF